MKKMTSLQKAKHNRVTKRRRKKYLKRREHVETLRAAEKRINNIRRRMAKLQYYRSKYKVNQPKGTVL